MIIKVCGIGVISSLGVGCMENFQSLVNRQARIGSPSFLETRLSVPVGEVQLSNPDMNQMVGLGRDKVMTRTSLLGAIAAKEALDRASIPIGKRVGLISATTVGGMDSTEVFYRQYMRNSTKGRLKYIINHDCTASTDFIAKYCGIKGYSTTISTACSSAANAILLGAEMLKANMLDYVIAGGTDALCKFTLEGFNSLKIVDPNLCTPFDRNRAGLNLGEGAGYVVLTNDKDCNEYLCTLAGYANRNDAFHQTASSECGEGNYLSMKCAIEMAKIDVKEIDYINLHGTGTFNNDSSECAAIKRVFGSTPPPSSSTKSFTGHTLAASGGIEAVFSILAIINRVRYANLRFSQEMENGFTPILLTDSDVDINYVLSNSFGFGGNCTSLIFKK